uniref:Ribosomal protein S10 n=1 Tax=Romanomermis culicivorax TaxID=13658 RepID=A0A915KVZ9_ROMCU
MAAATNVRHALISGRKMQKKLHSRIPLLWKPAFVSSCNLQAQQSPPKPMIRCAQLKMGQYLRFVYTSLFRRTKRNEAAFPTEELQFHRSKNELNFKLNVLEINLSQAFVETIQIFSKKDKTKKGRNNAGKKIEHR